MSKIQLTESMIRTSKGSKELYDFIESGLIVRITKNGTKSFSFRYIRNGKNRRFTFAKHPNISLSQARIRVQHFKNQLAIGKDPQVEKDKRLETVTFAELAEEFKQKHFVGLRDSTKDKYRRMIDNDLVPIFKDMPLPQITKKKIIKALDKKAYDDGCPTHANNMRKRLHTMFNFALRRDMIGINVVAHIDSYRSGYTRRERYYSQEEIRAIWEYLPQLEEPTKYLFMMLFYTGQRKGETRKAKWKYINLKNRMWIIPASLAKNKRTHEVPLSTGAVWLLKYLKKRYSDSKYVFPSRYLDKDCPIWRIDASTRNIKNNTHVHDFRPHDIRRTVATYCAKMRVRRVVVGKILNHKGLSGDSSVTAIYDRYSYKKEKAEALEKWYQKLQNFLNE